LSENTEQVLIGETSLPAETKIIPDQPEQDRVSDVKTLLENKKYTEAVVLAEEILVDDPENEEIQGYLEEGRLQLKTIQTGQLLQQGIASYERKQYSQSIREMREALKLDSENEEAKRYINMASRGIWRIAINGVIERQRKSEEEKDLLTLLSDMGSSEISDERKADAMLLFNYYDDIQSVVSNIKIAFSDSTHADISFSNLLTATYKKSGKKEVVFEGVKTWKMIKQGRDWKISKYK